MFSHIILGAKDIQESKKFYDATFAALGYGEGRIDKAGRCFYRADTGVFGISTPIDGAPACHGNGSTYGFTASSPEAADAWHAAGIANGGVACEDAPGVRGDAKTGMYLAYLRDPAGNKLCALHRLSA